MPVIYPTRPSVFLIADSIVQQAGGKMTIIGAFAGGQMLVPPGSVFPVSFPLAVYAVFNDGEGKFNTSVSVLDPSNAPLAANISLGETVKTPNQPLQIAISFNMFQFPVEGTYKVVIRFDEQVYTNDISVRVSDKPIV